MIDPGKFSKAWDRYMAGLDKSVVASLSGTLEATPPPPVRERAYLPDAPGFYYWQPPELASQWGHFAIYVVQVTAVRDASRGFYGTVLSQGVGRKWQHIPLREFPPGRWWGPLPDPENL